ncbi:MAG: hydroxyacid dehydrogenase [Caldilineaceae bacterium]
MKAIYLLPEQNFSLIYGPAEQRDITARVELVAPRQDAQSIWQQPVFTEVEAIFSGWGMVKMDAAFFERFPNLKVLFYGAGAVDRFITEEVWSRGVQISNANVANGTSVAEYTVAQILLCLKQVWPVALRIKQERRYAKLAHEQVTGAYGSTVGIISLGAIGRMVAERLRIAKVNIIAYDPYMSNEQAQAFGVELTTLDDLFRRADVITCHTPWLPETEGMLHGELFRLMKPNAAFINTARGAIVNEADLCAVLRERPDLFAILDVTWPEPPAPDSPLFTLPNLILTPHIAGSMGHECWRMGRMMVEELDRWLAGEPLRYRVTRAYARARG